MKYHIRYHKRVPVFEFGTHLFCQWKIKPARKTEYAESPEAALGGLKTYLAKHYAGEEIERVDAMYKFVARENFFDRHGGHWVEVELTDVERAAKEEVGNA